MEIKNVKGTHDVYDQEARVFKRLEGVLSYVAELYAYQPVTPPVLEASELFVRSVGDSSDIVRKEMYTFLDKGERSLTLRPEFTAGIMRLLVQNRLLVNTELPVRSYYCGPVFRYERPQQGRYRQFVQFGVESVGSDSYLNDVEVIMLAYTMLSSIGLDGVTLKINTLGDEASREAYKTALVLYFKDKIDGMCEDCKTRFELNPLRILDCKVPEDIEIVKGAPKMSDYLSKEAKERFEKVCNMLDVSEIPYEVDDTLVRGLDYYSQTVFEFHYTSQTGNNYGAIGAGGYYEKLVKELGGPALPGMGFSFGVERLYSVLKDDGKLLEEDLTPTLHVYMMPLSEDSKETCVGIMSILRINNIVCDMCYDSTKLGNMFKRAEKKHAQLALIVGDDEVKGQYVNIKNLRTQVQEKVEFDQLLETISSMLEQEYNETHEALHECECGCGCGHHHDGEHCECGCHDEDDGECECHGHDCNCHKGEN